MKYYGLEIGGEDISPLRRSSIKRILKERPAEPARVYFVWYRGCDMIDARDWTREEFLSTTAKAEETGHTNRYRVAA